MNTEKKPGKFQVIFRFLKGSFYLFVLSLVFSVLFTACNALTPQIIRYAVDHILTGVGDSYGRHLLFLGGRGRSCGGDFVRNLQLFQQDDTGKGFREFHEEHP